MNSNFIIAFPGIQVGGSICFTDEAEDVKRAKVPFPAVSIVSCPAADKTGSIASPHVIRRQFGVLGWICLAHQVQ